MIANVASTASASGANQVAGNAIDAISGTLPPEEITVRDQRDPFSEVQLHRRMQVHQVVRAEQVRLTEISSLGEKGIESAECPIRWVPVSAGNVRFEPKSRTELDRFDAVTRI